MARFSPLAATCRIVDVLQNGTIFQCRLHNSSEYIISALDFAALDFACREFPSVRESFFLTNREQAGSEPV